MASPLRSVLDAIEQGARSRADCAVLTGLQPDVVDAAVDHLVRIGRLQASSLSTGCPDGGCGTCSAGPSGASTCGAGGAAAGRPTLVQLTVRR